MQCHATVHFVWWIVGRCLLSRERSFTSNKFHSFGRWDWNVDSASKCILIFGRFTPLRILKHNAGCYPTHRSSINKMEIVDWSISLYIYVTCIPFTVCTVHTIYEMSFPSSSNNKVNDRFSRRSLLFIQGIHFNACTNSSTIYTPVCAVSYVFIILILVERLTYCYLNIHLCVCIYHPNQRTQR